MIKNRFLTIRTRLLIRKYSVNEEYQIKQNDKVKLIIDQLHKNEIFYSYLENFQNKDKIDSGLNNLYNASIFQSLFHSQNEMAKYLNELDENNISTKINEIKPEIINYISHLSKLKPTDYTIFTANRAFKTRHMQRNIYFSSSKPNYDEEPFKSFFNPSYRKTSFFGSNSDYYLSSIAKHIEDDKPVNYIDNYYLQYLPRSHHIVTQLSMQKSNRPIENAIIRLYPYNLSNFTITNQINIVLYTLLCPNIYIYAENIFNRYIQRICNECGDLFHNISKDKTIDLIKPEQTYPHIDLNRYISTDGDILVSDNAIDIYESIKKKYTTLLISPSLPMKYIQTQLSSYNKIKSILITTPSMLPLLLSDEVKCKRIYFHNIVQYLSTSNFMIYTLSHYKQIKLFELHFKNSRPSLNHTINISQSKNSQMLQDLLSELPFQITSPFVVKEIQNIIHCLNNDIPYLFKRVNFEPYSIHECFEILYTFFYLLSYNSFGGFGRKKGEMCKLRDELLVEYFNYMKN